MRRLAVLIAAALFSTAPHPARAAGPLVLAFNELLPWKTQRGSEYGGAYTEIVRELARRTGQPLVIIECPLKRCLHMLRLGTADIIIGLRDTPERRSYLSFLRTPYRTRSSDKVFYVPRGRAASIRKYSDLADLRIGTKLGAEYLDRFDSDTSLKKEAVKDMETNFRKLALGRLDALLIPEDQGEALMAQLQLGSELDKALYRIPDNSPRSIAVSRLSPAATHLQDYENAMHSMAADGTLANLYKRHYYDALHVAPGAVQIR